MIFVCLLMGLTALIYPIYVIRPFRAQGPRELMVALIVMRFRLPFGSCMRPGFRTAAMVLNWRWESRLSSGRTGSLFGALAGNISGAALPDH